MLVFSPLLPLFHDFFVFLFISISFGYLLSSLILPICLSSPFHPFYHFVHILTDWTLPECFSDHILVSDSVVGQGFAPHGVERVVQRLGAKFIGLEENDKENKWQS